MTRVVLFVEGGVVQSAISDFPCEVLAMDYDCEGSDTSLRDPAGAPYQLLFVPTSPDPKATTAIHAKRLLVEKR